MRLSVIVFYVLLICVTLYELTGFLTNKLEIKLRHVNNQLEAMHDSSQF